MRGGRGVGEVEGIPWGPVPESGSLPAWSLLLPLPVSLSASLCVSQE